MKSFVVFILFLFFIGWSCFNGNKNKKTISEKDFIKKYIPDFITDRIYFFTDNNFTEEKATLGRYLFYDTRLSVNNTKACASCHDPKFSFTDSYRRSIGSYGDLTPHNAPPLINLVFNRYLTAADSTLHFPEQQIQRPMFNDHPIELGWKNNEEKILQHFSTDNFYKAAFEKGFPDEANPVTVKNIQYAITCFIKTIISFNSPYDAFVYQNKKDALTPSAQRGMQLFRSNELKCAQCHGGVNFNQPVFQSAPFFNTGFFTDTILNKGLAGNIPLAENLGKYKVPTLRNLLFTAPYLHDGGAESLTVVIQQYEQGGKKSVINKHAFIGGFKLNSHQRSDLVAFLQSLSDSGVLNNPAYNNPWKIK